ncbi:MAG: HD domain-containing protein, partial [Candidatus Marinimicrobia bacterium]|nr:HD domain-containing protein [Candidatus Neomarinimicrobiota bacterium]
MRDAIVATLPELGEIEDVGLRDKVIAVWDEALKKKEWKIETLKRMPFTLLVAEVNISFIEHVRTVCKMCIAMEKVLNEMYGDRVNLNHDYLVAGALLADVGKIYEYDDVDGNFVKSEHGKYLRHPFSGVGLSFRHDLPDEVMHIIAVHSKEGEGFQRT